MNFRGVIIEESLEDRSPLTMVTIVDTVIEKVTPQHKTPWLTKWTLDTFEIPEGLGDAVAQRISTSLDKNHPWYADFKNDTYHYIIYRNNVFRIERNNPHLYKDAKRYGVSLGIPEHQLDFAPKDTVRER